MSWSLQPSITGRELVSGALRVRQHDHVLVDCGAYIADGGPHWCRVTLIAAGTASVYPIKVKIPGAGNGQFKPEEILEHRRPERMLEAEAYHLSMGAKPHDGNWVCEPPIEP